MTEFGTLNLDEMAGEDLRLSNEGGGNFLDQFVPMPDVRPGQTGSVIIRILPPVKGGSLFQYNRTHKINNRSIHCPRPLKSGKWDRAVACPICDYYSSLWKQIEKLEQDYGKDCPQADDLRAEARELKPVERYYYNAIVRSMTVDGKEIKNAGPKILSVGKILHTMIIRAIVGTADDPESKLGNIADLKNGWDFIIRKSVTSGQNAFPKYDSSSFARNSSPAGEPEEIARWAENLHDLTKLRNPKALELLEKELAIHRGLIPDETEGMNLNDFDAKWGKKAETEVTTLVTEVTGTTQVATSVTTAPTASNEAATTSAPPSEDVAIEDEDFLKELAGMEG